MAQIIVYGIPNCDTIKKTLTFFTNKKIKIKFWDYKKLGITNEKLTNWCNNLGWQALLNKKSKSSRALNLGEQEKIIDIDSAIKLMIKNTSIIKRPVIENGKKILVGLTELEFKTKFKTKTKIK